MSADMSSMVRRLTTLWARHLTRWRSSLALPYPGGPNVEALARKAIRRPSALPRPMVGREDANFSFSGLKTAVRQIVRSPVFADEHPAPIWQHHFKPRLLRAWQTGLPLRWTCFAATATWHAASTLVIAGGVAANGAIRSALSQAGQRAKTLGSVVPPSQLCTDNGAMIAWAGVEHAQRGRFD